MIARYRLEIWTEPRSSGGGGGCGGGSRRRFRRRRNGGAGFAQQPDAFHLQPGVAVQPEVDEEHREAGNVEADHRREDGVQRIQFERAHRRRRIIVADYIRSDERQRRRT